MGSAKAFGEADGEGEAAGGGCAPTAERQIAKAAADMMERNFMPLFLCLCVLMGVVVRAGPVALVWAVAETAEPADVVATALRKPKAKAMPKGKVRLKVSVKVMEE
jgi:hypothetical protein